MKEGHWECSAEKEESYIEVLIGELENSTDDTDKTRCQWWFLCGSATGILLACSYIQPAERIASS